MTATLNHATIANVFAAPKPWSGYLVMSILIIGYAIAVGSTTLIHRTIM